MGLTAGNGREIAGGAPTLKAGGQRWAGYASIYLRLAIGTAFLSAVADRFGVWGRPGAPDVAWGNFHHFLAYAATLNPWFPAAWIPVIGWIATAAEVVFGAALILGYRTRIAAFLAGLLLLAFALGMTFGVSVKAPLDDSVFTASAGSFLLAAMGAFPFSLDGLRAKRRDERGVETPG